MNTIRRKDFKKFVPSDPNKVAESRIQSEAFLQFWGRYPEERQLLHANDNNSSNSIEGNLKRAVGTVAGVSDMEYSKDFTTHFIEFKTPTGTQSDDQITFQKRVESEGFPYYIVRSFYEGFGLFEMIRRGYFLDSKAFR